ncbi:hypothetical protein [Leptothoe sp. PORK10 BA2]|uniref:hypothetical protein n=1 Tax=Leptothoe sp. PORK10 BA2 TaxID=3110254 RepID=UPI002B217D94|nr:hypothetical protein [Leptothoe sp. PORK10 BA2]MEA5463270.1 hypothetical protein [Leptothoe sp. PORK10 BA2]
MAILLNTAVRDAAFMDSHFPECIAIDAAFMDGHSPECIAIDAAFMDGHSPECIAIDAAFMDDILLPVIWSLGRGHVIEYVQLVNG